MFQISMQQNKMNQEGSELMNLRQRASDCQRLFDEQKKKMVGSADARL